MLTLLGTDAEDSSCGWDGTAKEKRPTSNPMNECFSGTNSDFRLIHPRHASALGELGAARRSNGSKRARGRSNGRGCHADPLPPNAVRFQLYAFAHNLDNFMRTLALSKAAKP